VASIMTVQGEVPADSAGPTLMHEHIFTDMLAPYGENFTDLRDLNVACSEVARFTRAGGGTIVDVTSRGLGRDPRQLRHVSQQTGAKIVMGCSYYLEPAYPAEVLRTPIHRLRDLLLREIEEGVDDTGIRPGIIGEIAIQRYEITPAFERVLRAAARASRVSGLAISLHDHTEQMAPAMIDILTDEHVPMDRVCLGHQGNRDQMDYLRAIADHGAYIQIDHVGREFLQLDQERARVIAMLVREGYGQQILLSHDVCTRRDLAKFGGPGYDHILCRFVPLLEQSGLSPEQIRTILVDNPRRVLSSPD
jgi:predicted metal-dependent phosphotriesterase family hydrolase